MPQLIESVLFDLDGTLIDTAPDFVVCVNQLRRHLGKNALADDIISQQVSNGARILTLLAMDLLPENGIDEKNLTSLCDSSEFADNKARLLEHYHNIAGEHAAMYPGMPELLESLKANAISWGIVTNKPERYAIALLQKMRLYSSDDILVCPDHVAKPKPAPDAVELALSQLQLPAATAIYIGDHERDIIAGKAANTRTIAAAYGYLSDPNHCESWGADHIAHKVTDISDYIANQR